MGTKWKRKMFLETEAHAEFRRDVLRPFTDKNAARTRSLASRIGTIMELRDTFSKFVSFENETHSSMPWLSCD